MDDRQWATFVAQAGIQADNTLRTFTPASWTGFSVAPVGVISYQDFGDIVVLTRPVSALTGTSNAADMTFTGLPENLRPDADTITHAVSCITLLNGVEVASIASVGWTGVVTFGAGDTTTTAGRLRYTDSYNTIGSKGLPAGWFIIYPKR